MKKDLKTIIKEAADRYGLEYNEQQLYPTLKRSDGTVEIIKKENFYKALGLNNKTIHEKWSKVPGEKPMTWVNNTTNEFNFTEDFKSFKYEEQDKIVA